MGGQQLTGKKTQPLFEFRSFGRNFDQVESIMARLSMPVPGEEKERSSDEIYILSLSNDVNNTKIRDNKMDIKSLVQTVEGMEQWDPWMQRKFPISAKLLVDKVFPAFRVRAPQLAKKTYSENKFIELIKSHPELQMVPVHKHRVGYLIDYITCETCSLLIHGARFATVSCESALVEDLKRTIRLLGLEGLENLNYIQAIKRVIGMIDKPLEN